MSKKRRATTVNLADFKKRKEDEGAVEIVAEDGEKYRVPPPELWPDEAQEMIRTNDLIGLARAVMGEERFEAFCKAGGSATVMGAILEDVHGQALGE